MRRIRHGLLSVAVSSLALLATAMSTSCSVKRIAVNKLGDALAGGGQSYSSDNDPELVREAVPFSLKLMESLLDENPKHRGLLLAACKGFTQYAYAFVQEDADELEAKDLQTATRLRDRARNLYLRARGYGVRSLEVKHPGIGQALHKNPSAAAKTVTAVSETRLLYWTAASWGAAISLSKNNPELVADQPIVQALIDRALELDEKFDSGSIHSFLIAYEPSRLGGRGDPIERSRRQFQRAVELSNGQLASPYVSLAENVSVAKQNKAEFQAMLDTALAVDTDARPEWRLENLLMQRRARWLLGRVGELFID